MMGEVVPPPKPLGSMETKNMQKKENDMRELTWNDVKMVLPRLCLDFGGLVWVNTDIMEKHNELSGDSLFKEYSGYSEEKQIRECISSIIGEFCEELSLPPIITSAQDTKAVDRMMDMIKNQL